MFFKIQQKKIIMNYRTALCRDTKSIPKYSNDPFVP